MRLTSLTLQGFKSFADRTTVEFTEGVTAIVGPNGSGKSNLIDALRWASGGGRASEFRALDKRELIFHGAAGKRGVGFAEVQLELERSGRTLSVSRTLYRGGESQLRVGGRAARFLDLDDELSGSGLGRGALAVIGQGEVSEVLMADPPRLLAYVAESVGVAKLAARREGALARLAEAQDHLSRLEGVRSDLAARVAALGEEAAQAERAALAARELLQLRFTLSRRRVSALREELAELRERQGLLEAEVLGGRGALSDAQEARRSAKAEASAAEAEYRAFVTLVEARRGDLRVARERLRATETRLGGLNEERERLAREVGALAELSPPRPPEGDEASLRREEAEASADLSRSQAAVRSLSDEVEGLERALLGARRAEAEARTTSARYISQKEGLEAQRLELETRSAALAAELEGAHAALREATERHSEGALRVQSHQEALAVAQEELVRLQRLHAEASAEASARGGAAARLRAAMGARRGYAQGPKSALTSGVEGILGSVADLITVPPAYLQAVSSALGRRAENVVVTSPDVAQAVLTHVRRAGGWVTLLPLELMKPRPARFADGLLQEAAVVGQLSELVQSEPRFAGVVKQLLGAAVLVETLPAAVALARRYPQRPRLVTLSGDVLEAYGAISGGKPQAAGLVLGAALELREAERAAAEATEAAETATESLQAQQAQTKTLQAELVSAAAAQRQAEAAEARARESQASRASLAAELERRGAQVEAALGALEPPTELDAPDPAPLEAALREAQTRLGAAREGVSEAQRGEAASQAASALWLERRESFRAAARRFDDAQARLGAMRARAARVADELSEAEAQREAAQRALTAAQAALPQDLDAPKVRFEAAQLGEQRAETALERLSQLQAARAGERESLNLTLARREVALGGAEAELEGFPPSIAVLEGSSAKRLRERLAEVEAGTERLGPVNHRAALELSAQRARLELLSTQMTEAQGAASALHEILAELDEAVRVRLVAGTERLAEGFSRYAEHLFGAGAEASVQILWEEGRPRGLKLGLQPPGKQTRALSLLSVGERTMGALAFLFALSAPDPLGAAASENAASGLASGISASEVPRSGLPLAILDEVDAPLDEANIRRFCTFLGELAERGTQFVLITHQKATMETAGALWGVTTERGVSRVFSIRRGVAA